MDREQQHQQQAEAAEHQFAEGLEEHAERHETRVGAHEVPGVDHASLANAAEHGAEEEDPQSEVDAINAGVSLARTKKWNKRENKRLAARKGRIKARTHGHDWTAGELASVMKTHGAEGVLVALNARHPVQGVKILQDTHHWGPLLAALPQGHLGGPARQALCSMIEDGVFHLAAAEQLFEVRFKHKALDVAPQHWSMSIMQVLWRQLDKLPAEDVTLNTAISAFRAIAGGTSYGPGGAVGTIDIGQAAGADHENLEKTVRHEVGHAVHSEIADQVNPWLEHDMQFWYEDFGPWVDQLGGFPDHFVDQGGTQIAFDAAWKAKVVGMVDKYTNSGQWGPTKKTVDAGDTADENAAWQAMPGTVKNACVQSTANWYQNFEHFQAVSGKRFFLNHWYHTAYTIGPVAMACIKATNDSYSAMSEKEFFANCYAEFFGNPAGVTNQALWGGSLPHDVQTFFREVVISRHPYKKFKEQQSKPKH